MTESVILLCYYKDKTKEEGLAMNNNIITTSIENHFEKRLNELFPAGVPEDVMSRYKAELACMCNTESEAAVYDYMKLAEAVKSIGHKLIIRQVANNSLIIFLAGNDLVNPLAAYYYCKKCGRYERIASTCYGIEAPKKSCPKCGTDMTGEGFSLEPKFVWSAKGNRAIDIKCSVDITSIDYTIGSGISESSFRTELRNKCLSECFIDGNDLKDSPFYSRESLYKLLVEAGNDEITAFEVTELVRKGIIAADYSGKQVPPKWHELKEKALIPEDIMAYCRRIQYLESEGEIIARILTTKA